MPKKLNPYFTAMLAAKKKNAPSFSYSGNLYVRTTGKNGLVIYKKKN